MFTSTTGSDSLGGALGAHLGHDPDVVDHAAGISYAR